MEKRKYGNEVRIRRNYGRFGWRRTYRQRVYWSGEEIQVNTREEWRWDPMEGRRRSFVWNRGRRWMLIGRTRRPGRFRHESRQAQRKFTTRGRRVRRGSWKWFESSVEVSPIDRRASRWRRVPYRWRRIRQEDPQEKRGETRLLRRWVGRRGLRRTADRNERSERRSVVRSLRGYRRWRERWLRVFTRTSGRKSKKKAKRKEKNERRKRSEST